MANGIANWDFSDRVVVVTNAGLPPAIAQVRAFADAGATVLACTAAGKHASRSNHELGGREQVTVIEVDLIDEPAVADLAKHIDAEHGRLDALVMNDVETEESPLLEVSVEVWQQLVDLSLTASFFCAKHLVPIMARARYGKIVLTTGPETSTGIRNRAHICATRHALAGFAKDLAIEVAEDQINANTVESGDLDSAAAVAALTHSVMWLCSDASRFVTGAVVGGGTTPLASFTAAR